jgi:S1-C subfamily serine protease
MATGDVQGETRRKVLSVSDDSPAKAAGFQVGDVLLSMDGVLLTDGETLNRFLADKSWGDSAEFVVSRQPKDGVPQELSLKVYFRRRAPAGASR